MDGRVIPDSTTDRNVRFAAGVCAVAAGALAVFVLASWLSGQWRLGTLGADYVVMAPSTACLMILLSVAAFFRRFFQNRDTGRFLARLAVTAIAATALLSWTRQLLGLYYPALEGQIDAVTVRMIGVSFSPTSSLTMTVMILTGTALFFDLSSLSHGRTWRYFGPMAAMAGLLTALVVILGYAMGAPMPHGIQTTQIALPTALCLALLNAAILLDASSGIWPLSVLMAGAGTGSPRMQRFAPALSILFVFLIVSMGIVGGLYLRRQQAAMLRAAQNEVDAVANAQVGLIVNWHAERMKDARFFMDAPFDAHDLAELLSGSGSGDAPAGMTGWLSVFASERRYRQIAVYDSRMNPRVSIPPDASPPDGDLREGLSAALRKNRVVMTDLGLEADGNGHIDILAPLCAKGGESPGVPSKAEAVVMLRADAREFVASLVPVWPGAGLAVETLLVRRKSRDMLPLSQGHAKDSAALKAGIPIEPADFPGSMAARGEAGIAAGLDHRGVPVVLAVRPVPGTPWSIVAKRDESDIYAPSRQQMVQAGFTLFLILLAAGLGVGILWRQRNIAFYREALGLEREHSALAQRFEHLMRHANDIMLLAATDGTILEANNRAVESYGYSLAALRRMNLSELRAPSARTEGARRMEELKATGSVLYESVHQRADGSTFSVEVSGSTVEIGGENCLLATVRDISERERAAEALRASEQNFRTLFDSIGDFLFVVDMAGNILRVNETVRARLGYAKQELTGKNLLFVHPEERREEASGILEDMLAGRTDHCSVPLVARDGRVIAVETHIVSGLWSGQEVLFGISRDISALRASEEKFVKVFQSNPSLMAISTVEEGRYLEVNETFVQALGYSREEIIGATSLELNLFVNPDQRAEMRSAIVEKGALRNFDVAVRRKDGEIRNGLFAGDLIQMQDRQVLLTVMNDVTELKRAEEALVRIGKAVDSTGDAIGISDPNGVHYYQNRAFTEMVGYTVAELASPLGPVMLYEDREAAREMFLATMRGESWSGEFVMVAKDGRRFSVAVQADAIKDERGDIIGLIGVHRDITALRASEERFVKIFQSAPTLMILSTLEEGRYLDANEVFLKTLGYKREEVVGRTSLELNVYANPAERSVMKEAIIRTGFLRNYEMKARRKDGQLRTLLVSCELIRVQDEQLILSAMSDMTELRNAEESLVRLGKAVEGSSDAIVMADPNGVHFYQNRAFTEMFGYTVEELGAPSGPMQVYPDPAKGREIFDTIMRGASWHGELDMRAKDGRHFPVSVQADAIKDERGNIVALIGVHRDIIEQRRQEMEVQRLLEQTLRDARTKAELLAEVNHRVKNNLTSILGLLLGEKQHAPAECYGQVVSVIDSLAQRIRGLLHVHQMLSDAHWEPIRVNDLAVRVIRAALVAVPRGREISVTVKPSPAQISPRQAGSMALVINELTVNTAKHALQNRGAVNIMVGVSQEDKTIRMEYRDDGPGYPGAVLEEGGGGVGMHLVRQLVCETLRGTLHLYNEDGAVAVLCIKTEDLHHTWDRGSGGAQT